MYNNLIYFLVAIFLFSLDSVPKEAFLSIWQAWFVYIALIFSFSMVCRRSYSRLRQGNSTEYFKIEKKLSILALIFYAGVLYFCDIKYYLEVLSLGGKSPALANIVGLGFFVVFLSLMWGQGCASYWEMFGGQKSKARFIVSNIKSNLPIVLPWVIFSLATDFVMLLPIPWLHEILKTAWGDFVFFLLFFLFVLILLPPLVQRLWRCRPLPAGELREHLDEFCQRQNFSAKYFIWPLMEGRAMTAGVMGLVPGLRYILLTPAIIEAMDRQELDAIMAHEIAHAKKGHIFLYFCLILGFSLIAGFLAEPLLYFVLSFDVLLNIMVRQTTSPETIVSIVGGVPLLAFVIIYFRFFFGFFMRNFERQADLYTIGVMGSAAPLISAFAKISLYTGTDRKESNWHHFGVGERIDCLQKAEQFPEDVRRHDKKMKLCLVAYFVFLVLVVVAGNFLSKADLEHRYKEKYTESVLYYHAGEEPNNPLWPRLIGDMMYGRKMDSEAVVFYRKALELDGNDPEVLNNLAWLLITSGDKTLRNPEEALSLARTASILAPYGHILDTLATAYWATGLTDLAIQTELAAMQKDPEKANYYRLRIRLFQRQTYQESFPVQPQQME